MLSPFSLGLKGTGPLKYDPDRAIAFTSRASRRQMQDLTAPAKRGTITIEGRDGR